MHQYIERPGDIVSTQLYTNGVLYSNTISNNGRPANGWSSKTYYPGGELKQEENFSNGLLIEEVYYDEKGSIKSHKIWNNRLRLLVDKTDPPKLRRPNVVTGSCSLPKYLEVLPGIAVFINAIFDREDLLRSYETFLNTGEEDLHWRMKGTQMNFTIYWANGELFHQWHCHCFTEENFWKARSFLETTM